MHALASLGIVASGLPLVIKLAAVAVLAAHAGARRPAPPESVIGYPDGTWALPERAVFGLELMQGTSAGPFWILLRLGHGRFAESVLLLRDQIPQSEWRALQAAVRRAKI